MTERVKAQDPAYSVSDQHHLGERWHHQEGLTKVAKEGPTARSPERPSS